MREAPSIGRLHAYPATVGLGAMAALVSGLSWSGRSIEALTVDARAFSAEPWRLVASALPHADLLHLAFNLLWLWTFGARVEATFGHARTLALYALLAAGSAAAEYALFDGGIGLSGIGYGLFGLLLVLSRRDARFAGVVDRRTTTLFVAWFFFCIATTVTGTWRVANVAHGAGAAIGALVGLAVSRRGRTKASPALALAALLTASALGATTLRPAVNLSSSGGRDSAYLGYQALEAGRNEEAIAHLSRAVEGDAEPGWHYNLAIAHQRAGDMAAAMAAYDRAAELAPDDPLYRRAAIDFKRYVAYEAQTRGDHARAAALYEEVLARGGDDYATLQGLGVSYSALGRAEEARRAFEQAALVAPSTEPGP